VVKSLRNLQHVQLIIEGELNAYDVLCNDWVIFTRDTLPGTTTQAGEAGTDDTPDAATEVDEPGGIPAATATDDTNDTGATGTDDTGGADAATEAEVEAGAVADDDAAEPADDGPAAEGDQNPTDDQSEGTS
jgi:hypothetical protein